MMKKQLIFLHSNARRPPRHIFIREEYSGLIQERTRSNPGMLPLTRDVCEIQRVGDSLHFTAQKKKHAQNPGNSYTAAEPGISFA
jgi:hypothetical protein